MKRMFLALLGCISGILGLLVIPTLLYNLAGLFKIQDGAEGPKWELTLVVLACVGLISAAFFLSYRLLRLAAASRQDLSN